MSNHSADKLDELTGLSRDDEFAGMLEAAISRGADEQTCVSCALLDIDFFQRINDEHGHVIGDRILRTIAASLSKQLADAGSVFRYGGDQFAVILPGVEKEQAFLRMEKVRQSCEGEHTFGRGAEKVSLTLTVSAGIACHPDDGASLGDTIRKSTEALYRAKTTGRNKICLAREEKMVTKTSHYTQGQLAKLSQLAKREGVGEAFLLREALDDLFKKYDEKQDREG